MEIKVADEAGFCQGVKNAVEKTEQAVKDCNKVHTLGPVVHNQQVVDRLTNKGVRVIDTVEELQDEDSCVVIRSHGVGPEVFNNIEKQGHTVIDATCHFVEKVQHKAKALTDKGYQVVIVGDPNHPEIIGINSWTSGQANIVESADDINMIDISSKSAVVVQTTFSETKFNSMVLLMKKKNPNIEVYNTICHTTTKRQKSTVELAKEVDVMIVIGGANSSNTTKLKEISEYFVTTYHVENAQDLRASWFWDCKMIGVTAGASTPDWTIKEVIETMKNFEENANGQQVECETQKELMENYADSKVLSRGQVIEGKIVQINDEEALIDVGYKTEGVVPKNEIFLNDDQSISDILTEGEQITVKVVTIDDENDTLVLSKKWADKDLIWDKLEERYKNGEEFTVEVSEEVKGGLIANLDGIRGFIPASHVERFYVPDLSQYIGHSLRVKIIELDRSKNKVVLSQKEILDEEYEVKKQEIIKDLQQGDIVEGTIKRLTNFGAFIDLGGIDGLCHISEISHERIEHPADVLKEEQSVTVKVLNVDPDTEKISLSIKGALPDPWEKVASEYQASDIVTGKVVRLVNFGAFIEIIPGVEGLCHISQLDYGHVEKPEDVISEGDEVKVKILDIDANNNRISLSIKEAKPKETKTYTSKGPSASGEETEEDDNVTLGDVFGDLLGDIKENDDKEEK